MCTAMEETLYHQELSMELASTAIRLAWHHGHKDLAKRGLQILKQKVQSPPDLGHLHLLSLVRMNFVPSLVCPSLSCSLSQLYSLSVHPNPSLPSCYFSLCWQPFLIPIFLCPHLFLSLCSFRPSSALLICHIPFQELLLKEKNTDRALQLVQDCISRQ